MGGGTHARNIANVLLLYGNLHHTCALVESTWAKAKVATSAPRAAKCQKSGAKGLSETQPSTRAASEQLQPCNGLPAPAPEQASSVLPLASKYCNLIQRWSSGVVVKDDTAHMSSMCGLVTTAHSVCTPLATHPRRRLPRPPPLPKVRARTMHEKGRP